MIQNFSEGYYCLSMNVQEYDDGPVIERRLHSFIQNKVFSEESPILMRVGMSTGPVFDVRPEGAVPSDVLALPQSLFDEQGLTDVFVLKPEYNDYVGEYDG